MSNVNDPKANASTVADILAAVTTPSTKTLEEQVEEVLAKKRAAVVEKLRPKEPDYKTLTEADIYREDLYIPVIEHDIPEYMDVKPKDSEYICVWASRDQRRLGQLLAEGYEFLKPEHVSGALPLKFDSEGLYIYQDVICMRVHKKIIYAKRRRVKEVSERQLKPDVASAKTKAALFEKSIAGDSALEHAFGMGRIGFYDPTT